MVMPGMPASPKKSAYTLQRKAAVTPTEMRVSMLAMKRRALCSATRWNGHAPQTATGDARASTSHCQFVNCSAGIIDSTSTGTVSTVEMRSRCRSAPSSSGALGAEPFPP